MMAIYIMANSNNKRYCHFGCDVDWGCVDFRMHKIGRTSTQHLIRFWYDGLIKYVKPIRFWYDGPIKYVKPTEI